MITTYNAIQLAASGILTHDEARTIALVDVKDKRNLDLLPSLVNGKIITVDEARTALGLSNGSDPVVTKPAPVEVRPAPAPVKVEPKVVKVEPPVKVEPVKVEPVKVEATKLETPKVAPVVKVETPAPQVEPVKVEVKK